ncbi:MAG: HNH endonuclease [Alphaproteobacteria bacterium]|nr:HNH endonuclease [Alphaproteobacteria bacterium]
MQAMVESYFPGERVTASTVLKDGAYGSKTALVQFKLGDKVVLEIPYCDRGFPIYDAVRKFEVRLPKEIWEMKGRDPHMKASTIKVREALESGAITESHLADWVVESHALKGETLTASELATKLGKMKEAIIKGKETIGEFTWHHHQEFGRMELVPEWIHDASKHTGGYSLSQNSMK